MSDGIAPEDGAGADPCVVPEYALTGRQVEPDAGYWMFCSRLKIVTIDELTAVTDDAGSRHFFPPFPDPCSDAGRDETAQEFDELLDLVGRRDEPCSLVYTTPCGTLDAPCNFPQALPKSFGCRRPISKLFNLMPSALGAVLVNRYPGEQIIRTGRGMARAVESETPGIFHRHALNYLISTRNWSPPRQALIWAALDVAIASALQAAWYYKWLSPRALTSRRQRPIEYARLDVLFDRPDELNPAYNLCPDGRNFNETCDPDNASNASGTPRHPAYPSGHSTYAGAASELLKWFFGTTPTPAFLTAHPQLQSQAGTTLGEELDNMADNIGMGRLWAGIHWRSDHEAGLKLGRTIACLVIQQLTDMGADFVLCPPEPARFDQCDCTQHRTDCDPTTPPPSRQDLQTKADAWKADCEAVKTVKEPCDAPPSSPAQTLDSNRGVQQGA